MIPYKNSRFDDSIVDAITHLTNRAEKKKSLI